MDKRPSEFFRLVQNQLFLKPICTDVVAAVRAM